MQVGVTIGPLCSCEIPALSRRPRSLPAERQRCAGVRSHISGNHKHAQVTCTAGASPTRMMPCRGHATATCLLDSVFFRSEKPYLCATHYRAIWISLIHA